MRKAVVAVAIIVVLTLAATLVLQRRGYLPMGSPVRQSPDVVLKLEDVRVVGRSKGRKVWSIHSKNVEVARSRVNTRLSGIDDGTIYDGGKEAAKIKAGNAIYNDMDRSLEVSGGIKVTAEGGVKLESKGARYDSWRNALICPEKVTLRSKKSVVEAGSLRANLRTNEVEAKKLRMRVEVGELEQVLEKQESKIRGKQ